MKSPSDSPQELLPGQKLTVIIEKLIFGGAGLARSNNQVIFVDNSAPQDELLIEITETKKNFALGKIIEILKASPYRVTPVCPVAGACGGCSWQHIGYEEQIHQKQLILQEAFDKHLKQKDFVLHPIQKSPKELRYRNRIQLKHHKGQVGYYKKHSHQLVPIQDCFIADEILAEKIPHLKLKDDVQHIEIKLSQDQSVQTIFNKETDESLGFSQVNELQNQFLIQTVLSWLETTDQDEIFDLYAGSGNFSFPLLEKNKKSKIIAVELSPQAVKWGQELVEKKNISYKQLSFLLSDVSAFLRRLPPKPHGLVILDPPRAGCDKTVMESMDSIGFKKMIYISCNFSSFIRDVNLLKNYKIVQIQPVDMFPQTDHIEIVAELVLTAAL